jgi:glucokinase
MNPTHGLHVIGVDIGGTKINIGLVNEHGEVLLEQTRPTSAKDPGLMDRVIEGIRQLISEASVLGYSFSAIGVGSAGQIHPETGAVYAASDLIPGYTGTPIRDVLQQAFDCPVAVDNDVNVLALAENYYGSAKGARHVICLTVGTGIGGAILMDGQLLHGINGGAGELGHLSVDMNGRKCICGSIGCMEAYASGTSIAQLMKERLSAKAAASDLTDLDVNAKTVVARWLQGDEDASSVMDTVFAALGTGIASIIHTFNPEKIIIGGGVADIGEPFFARLQAEVSLRTMPAMRQAVQIVPSFMGNRSGMIGAAALIWHKNQMV